MSESQEGEQTQGETPESQGRRFSPEFLAKQFKPGQSPNPGGIEKASGVPGMTLRARLRDKVFSDEERLDAILEARIALCEDRSIEPAIRLKATDDLFDQVEGKLEKTVAHKGEPTRVILNLVPRTPLPEPPCPTLPSPSAAP